MRTYCFVLVCQLTSLERDMKMKSQYLELKAIADNMYRLAQEAFNREKQEAIDWILAQMSLFGISVEQLEEATSSSENDIEQNKPDQTHVFKEQRVLDNLFDQKQNAFPKEHCNFQDPGVNSFLKPSYKLADPFKYSDFLLFPPFIVTPNNSKNNEEHDKTVKKQYNYNNYSVSINGVLYNNNRQACVELKLYETSVTRRCLSPNEQFKDWFFVSKDTGQPIPKMNVPRKRRLKTEEEKKKISESLTKFNADLSLCDPKSFISHSIEMNKKLSSKIKGRKLSEDTKEKLRLEAATRPLPKGFGQPVRINGNNYNSLSAAAKILKISVGTIFSRCKNKREEFKEWMYLPLNTQMLKQA